VAEAYLLFEAGGFRLLLAAGDVAQSLGEAPAAWSDLSVSLGGAPAGAWVACVDGANLGVSRILGLVDLGADAFAQLPPGDFVDAVTLMPVAGVRAFRVSSGRQGLLF